MPWRLFRGQGAWFTISYLIIAGIMLAGIGAEIAWLVRHITA